MNFAAQIECANELFANHNNRHLKSFLLKPETTTASTLRDVLPVVLNDIQLLETFDVIGVTEWELGTTMLDRMVNIASLRKSMDEAGQQRIPLHVFGALDPLSTILYFLCGAEIFDGLTWLRYAYDHGECVYRHNHSALNFTLDTRDELARSRILVNNYYYLRNLEGELRAFCSTGAADFTKLQPRDTQFRAIGPNMSGFLTKAMDTFNTRFTQA
jgi:hypothetical protein